MQDIKGDEKVYYHYDVATSQTHSWEANYLVSDRFTTKHS